MLIELSGESFTEDSAVITWQEWSEKRTDLIAKNEPVVLTFPNDEDIHQLSADIKHFKEIILDFPLFRDGRAYSQARILREELGFKDKLRASGDVLLDQALFMRRCGFDRFQLSDDSNLAEWLKAFKDFSLSYQPAADSMKTIWELRKKS